MLEESDQRRGMFRKSSLSRKAREALEKLTETTGGRAYFPKSVDEVGELCRQIAHDLRNHYTLGYTPSNKKLDGSWRKITVRVNPPKTVTAVTIRANEGYYAPKAERRTPTDVAKSRKWDSGSNWTCP
jgi:VWFA-related protein